MVASNYDIPDDCILKVFFHNIPLKMSQFEIVIISDDGDFVANLLSNHL